jgi:hypothetical protein
MACIKQMFDVCLFISQCLKVTIFALMYSLLGRPYNLFALRFMLVSFVKDHIMLSIKFLVTKVTAKGLSTVMSLHVSDVWKL